MTAPDESPAAVVLAVLPEVTVSETAEAILFDDKDGRLCTLRKPGEEAALPTAAPAVARYYDALLAALDDPLAERLLARGEVDHTTVAALLPPLDGPGFVGHPDALERVEVRADGRLPMAGEPALPPPGSLVRVGLLDGWLPAPMHIFRTETGTVEQLVFATADAAGKLVVWRRVQRDEAGASPRAELYEANGQPVSGNDFYLALLSLWRDRESFRRGGIRLDLPEPGLRERAEGMLQLGALTFRGLLPRYGVSVYDEERHNSFPPATLFLLQALLAWGHLDQAREVLSHYVSRYVKPDGSLDYYGPAVAEYGQLLALIVEVVRLADDGAWLRRRLTLLRPVWQRLLALRRQSKDHYPGSDPRHGLIPGLPEADYHGMADEWQNFYYAGDAWTCRGLREIGAMLVQTTEAHLQAEGEALLAEARDYQRDLLRSLQRVVDPETGYVPPGPDQPEPIPHLTENRHASYCNYRYFPEMISAGVLPAACVQGVLQWRRTHGGELLGMTRFEGHLDDWPALHVARALLEMDEADRYLLLMFAHGAHHGATGTLASYEQVTVHPGADGRRQVVAGQVLPCQVMVPVMLRWGLVYEEREADVLWLCRAIPRRWLADEQTVRVRRVPTRFGRVGFRISMSSGGEGEVLLRLPAESPFPAEIKLRLRLPEERVLHAVRLDGTALPLRGDLVTVPAGLSGKVRLQVQWIRA